MTAIEKRPLKVFLCHASADKPKVRELYRTLKRRSVQPWLDAENLIPGQNWEVEIPKALLSSDAIIICLSPNSVDKEGYVQKEIKFALDKASEMPEGRIFLIPARLEECDLPFSLRQYQAVNLYEKEGYIKLMKALKLRASQLERNTVELPKEVDIVPEIKRVVEEKKPVEPKQEDIETKSSEPSYKPSSQGVDVGANVINVGKQESPVFIKPEAKRIEASKSKVEKPEQKKAISLRKFLIVITVASIGLAGTVIMALFGSPLIEKWFVSTPIATETRHPIQNSTLIMTASDLVTAMPSNSDGKWIAFNSRMSGNADIYLVDIHGNNLTQLTTNTSDDLYPSWSSDGKRIVYQTNEGGDQELAIINVSDEEVTYLTNNECNDSAPVWSPANDWIVYYSDCGGERNIYKIRGDGSEQTQLTFDSGSYSWFPSWSPDGMKFTFSSNRSGKYHIYVMDTVGSNMRELAAGCGSYFSPDGSQILYGVYCNDTDELWLMNSDGSNKHAITDGCECKNATWSPDGTRIVFQLSRSTKDGPFSLYIMSLDNPQNSNWTLITDFDVNGGSPVWQP